jgi:DNA mismatch endonuclease, patch repair protein
MDTFSKSERSKIMASVKSKGNKSTELQFVSILKDKGITGWRRNYPLIGNPDFVFPREKTAVFIDGCFWHSCPLHCRMPASNKNYWNNKIEKNKIRDKKITRTLREKGWQVIRVWEHEIKSSKLNHKLNRMHNTYKASGKGY